MIRRNKYLFPCLHHVQQPDQTTLNYLVFSMLYITA